MAAQSQARTQLSPSLFPVAFLIQADSGCRFLLAPGSLWCGDGALGALVAMLPPGADGCSVGRPTAGSASSLAPLPGHRAGGVFEPTVHAVLISWDWMKLCYFLQGRGCVPFIANAR